MKLATIIGARPQFVKAATVSRALAASNAFEEIIVHTGQHYDENLSAVFFSELEIPAAQYHLGVGSASHGVQTARMLEMIEEVLVREKPDLVIVYGDTNSTLAGALAAAKLRIPVGHVEAGLRSFNRNMPEEVNRVVADHLSTLLFAPTETAVAQLGREGVPGSSIHLTGDVMYDAALQYADRSEQKSRVVDELKLRGRRYALCTIHRAENTDEPSRLRAIFDVLVVVARELPVILPLHPRTHSALERSGIGSLISSGMCVLPPAGYLDMIALQKNAAVVVTDSGGVQKEAFFYRIPCVTLRNETEWPELIQFGWNRLVDVMDTRSAVRTILGAIGGSGVAVAGLYGDGHAAERIVEVLSKCTSVACWDARPAASVIQPGACTERVDSPPHRPA